MMTLHPEVLAKAQREVDSVIGTDPERLPMLEDRKDLPYVECIVKELYRYVTRISELGGQRTYQQGF